MPRHPRSDRFPPAVGVPELEATCADPVFRAIAAYCAGTAQDPDAAFVPGAVACPYSVDVPWYALARFEEDPDRRPYLWELDEGDYVTDD